MHEGSYQYSLFLLIHGCRVLPWQLQYQAIIYRPSTATRAIVQYLHHKLWVMYTASESCHFFPRGSLNQISRENFHSIFCPINLFLCSVEECEGLTCFWLPDSSFPVAVTTDYRSRDCEFGGIGITLPTRNILCFRVKIWRSYIILQRLIISVFPFEISSFIAEREKRPMFFKPNTKHTFSVTVPYERRHGAWGRVPYFQPELLAVVLSILKLGLGYWIVTYPKWILSTNSLLRSRY